ncbi:MAG: hypothetical protein ABSB79_04155 [Syntrophales bacterium]|jgi:hypothetical protein
MKRKFVIPFACLLQIFVFMIFIAAAEPSRSDEAGETSMVPQTSANEEAGIPMLVVTPREIDLGTIRPGEGAKAVITLKNEGSGVLTWSARGFENWMLIEDQDISGSMERNPEEVMIHVSFLESISGPDSAAQNRGFSPVQYSLEMSGKRLIGRKDIPAGSYRQAVRFSSLSGSKTVLVSFKIDTQVREPQIAVTPTHIDFGVIPSGQQLVKRIKVTNPGSGTLKWRMRSDAGMIMDESVLPHRGRYVSFSNEEVIGRGYYIAPPAIKAYLYITGRWIEEEGFPVAVIPASGVMKYHFIGNGLSLFLWKAPDAGNVAVYLDDALIGQYDCHAERKESSEIIVAENLPDPSSHTMLLSFGPGRTLVEGVRIYGPEIKVGRPGWISALPDSGDITKQISFVNIRMDTRGLPPGMYMEPVYFTSNGGDSIVEVSVELNDDNSKKEIDIYRFVRGRNYLFSANPRAEAKRIAEYGYQKQGIAFRLFPAGTPGTTPFYRWYNAQRGCHFYAYEGKAKTMNLTGYALEGEIGNIATSKLTGTKELYRWYYPSKGCHFYTTDPRGENASKKGYKFDGIAGYVH